ncbi:hypothetical protein C0431_02780 [bacterium]|nr:hypothetical protein [bacterium]
MRYLWVMATNKFLKGAVGHWAGESKLHLSWLEDETKRVQKGPSELHVDLDESGAFATVTYWWTYEGKKQEGVMTVVCDEKRKKCFLGWVDAWHMNYDVMRFEGELKEESVGGFGKYFVGEGEPEWGWTIEVLDAGQQLKLRMENVTPGGEKEWAVEAIYSRA